MSGLPYFFNLIRNHKVTKLNGALIPERHMSAWAPFPPSLQLI